MRILSIPGSTHENPYFKYFCDSLEQAGLKLVHIRQRAAFLFAFDVLHVHFPTHFVTENGAVASLLSALAESGFFLICRVLGKPIVYTVHDVEQMNCRNIWVLKPFLRLFYRLCSGYIFLSGSSKDEFFGLFGDERKKPWIQIPHGPYPAKIRSAEERAEIRRRFTKSEAGFVVGFLGSIKQYKNLGVLLALPKSVGGGRQLRVVVAGRVEEQYKAEANAILSQVPEETLIRIDKRIPDEELNDFMQACDVVLLPYAKGWNSGAALLALSNRTRMLCSQIALFRELETLLPYWCTTFPTEKAGLDSNLGNALARVAAGNGGPEEEERLDIFLRTTSFSYSAKRVKEFYEQLSTRVEQVALTEGPTV